MSGGIGKKELSAKERTHKAVIAHLFPINRMVASYIFFTNLIQNFIMGLTFKKNYAYNPF